MKSSVILKLAQQLSSQQTQLSAKMNRRVESFKSRLNARMHPAMNITPRRVVLPGAEEFISEQVRSTLPIPQKGYRRAMPRKIEHPVSSTQTASNSYSATPEALRFLFGDSYNKPSRDDRIDAIRNRVKARFGDTAIKPDTKKQTTYIFTPKGTNYISTGKL